MQIPPTTFFKLVFGANKGYLCIVHKPAGEKKGWREFYFQWPFEAEEVAEHIERFKQTHDMWFCAQLLTKKSRRKEETEFITPSAWADLDECSPQELLVKPTVTVQSSPGRWQAYWYFDDTIHALDAEDMSRRIAYHHSDVGADRSGWDLSQVLRIPGTYNFKYGTTFAEAPKVEVTDIVNESIPYAVLDEKYPAVDETTVNILEVPLPTEIPEAADVLYKYRTKLDPYVHYLFTHKPEKDWSKSLWNLEIMLFEHDVDAHEVLGVVREAACNKYARDERNDNSLWKEVLRARQTVERKAPDQYGIPVIEDFKLLTEDQRQEVVKDKTFVEDYIEWAMTLTDASSQYHQAGAFIVLSQILASYIRIPTSFGSYTPNLWFMLLGDTTLTRKTTAMKRAMHLIKEIDEDAVLATDGSVEGIFGAIATKPGQATIFHRDEFSGLLEGMLKKDYMGGMAEQFTKLYDGENLKRVLRQSTIDIRDPVFLMFTGGTKTRILELLTMDQVSSGFVPRFVFVTAEADTTKLRPMGPPTGETDQRQKELVKRLQTMKDKYDQQVGITINNTTVQTQKLWNVSLTPEAWLLYNHLETKMIEYAMENANADVMTPSMDRLAKSGLKAAALIAASRMPEGDITMTEDDLLHAFYYVEKWRSYLIEVLNGIGASPYERRIEKLAAWVSDKPGSKRGEIMNSLRLSAKDADDIIGTAEQRGLLYTVKQGKGTYLYPPGYTQGVKSG